MTGIFPLKSEQPSWETTHEHTHLTELGIAILTSGLGSVVLCIYYNLAQSFLKGLWYSDSVTVLHALHPYICVRSKQKICVCFLKIWHFLSTLKVKLVISISKCQMSDLGICNETGNPSIIVHRIISLYLPFLSSYLLPVLPKFFRLKIFQYWSAVLPLDVAKTIIETNSD